MGIQRNENGGTGKGALFLAINAKLGCIQHNKLGADGKPMKGEDGKNIKIQEPATTQIVGTVVGLEFVDDQYQGEKNYKVRLAMHDIEPGQPKMFVDFPFGSEANGAGFFGLSLMAKLNAADLTKPISIMPWMIPAGSEFNGVKSTTDRTGVTVYQNGQKLKEDFGGGMARLPERQKVKVGTKEVTDNTEWDNIAQALLQGLVHKVTPGAGEAAASVDEDGVDASEVAAATQVAAAAAPAAAPTARPRFG
jgi:hypothetical protein